MNIGHTFAEQHADQHNEVSAAQCTKLSGAIQKIG